MTELEAIAKYFGIPIEEAELIYVDDITDEDYANIMELMRYGHLQSY